MKCSSLKRNKKWMWAKTKLKKEGLLYCFYQAPEYELQPGRKCGEDRFRKYFVDRVNGTCWHTRYGNGRKI